MIYIKLLLNFFKIGLFSIGGYAAIPLIQHQVVDVNAWLTMSQFADIMAIAEMTPGPIAINSATFVGIQIAGVPGAIIATIGCILPSCIIVTTLAYIYYRFKELKIMQGVLSGIRPAVVAMVGSAGISLVIMSFYGDRYLPSDLSSINIISLVIFILAFIVLRKFKVVPIYVMIGSGVLSIFLNSFF